MGAFSPLLGNIFSSLLSISTSFVSVKQGLTHVVVLTQVKAIGGGWVS